MITNLTNGLTALANGPAIAYLVGGSLLGMFLGVIPGLGGAVVLSIILAFIYHINDTGTLCLFLATQAGSYFSASITSILLNTPAHPEAFAVTFDGFPMAQRGEAGRALGISASSTMFGGLIGCAVLVGFLPLINYLPDLFHPPEYVALITLALVLVGTLGTDAISKALVSAGAGLMLSTVGPDPISGDYRYTFNAVGLYSGISLVALFLGLFAIPQMILVFGTATTIARQDMMGNEVAATSAVRLERGFSKQVMQGVGDTLHHWVALIRAGLVGVITGIVPGIGGFAANFMSYGIAQQVSKKRSLFGTGIPEGIIAPEGSSLSKEAGGMIPLLGLGIPGGVGGALFLAALTIRGVRVGFGFTTQYPTLAYETVWIIALGGLVGTVAGLLTAPQLAKVTRVPGPLLVPLIMSISVVGTFAADIDFFSLAELMVFAVVGFALRRLRYSLAVFGIGLILGPQLEQSIYQTREIYPGISFLQRGLADFLFALTIFILVLKAVQLRRDAKKADVPLVEGDEVQRTEELLRRARLRHPYPLLGMITVLVIIAIAIPFLIYTAHVYPFKTGLMPMIAGSVVLLAALWRLPQDVGGYINHRRELRQPAHVGAPLPPAEEPVPVVAGRALAEEGGGGGGGTDGVEFGDLVDLMEVAGAQPSGLVAGPGGPELPPIVDKTWGRYGQYTRELIAFGWFAALLGLTWLLGMQGGPPAFCVLYGLTATRYVLHSWWKRVLFSAFSALAIWLAAHYILSLLHLSLAPALHL